MGLFLEREFRGLRAATEGSALDPRFFEKNRVKLFSPGNVRVSLSNSTASINPLVLRFDAVGVRVYADVYPGD